MIEKYFEIVNGKQIDRFHVKNISVNDFIDTILAHGRKVVDITKDEFDSGPNAEWFIDFDVDGKFEFRHYVKEFKSDFDKQEWIEMIREYRAKNLKVILINKNGLK